MELLKEYFKLQKEIHDHFGYVEDWVVIPLDDQTDMYWKLLEHEVYYADNIHDLETEEGNCYSGIIYTQRFLPKYVYKSDDYTMVSVDTQCDGNKFLMVFDNKKKID